ncbi:MAG: calcineurin-like phosphoesterase family protein [Bacteroidales bacterium]|nr:calcineurin-like phosphoesterase family protein [Bacteroidales bacterium]MCF8391686.1 calcineurin-like phosphoesterase family protein [Bacteroidales bacterium]
MKNRNIQVFNMTGITRFFRWLKLPAYTYIIAAVFLFSGCEDNNKPIITDPGLSITGVSIPSSLNVLAGGDITITGKGFESGDQIKLSSTSDSNIEFTITINSASYESAIFTIPVGLSTGSYKITVLRADESQVLGTIMINIIVDLIIPDIDGMTVKGIVYCNGLGVPGVVVSDGIEVTETDLNGIYYLPSEKKNGYVFISVPGNYEVSNAESLPIFYKRLAGGSSVEQKDFSLIETDNSNHVVLAMADWHLANRNDDNAQFNNGFLQDVNALIDEYKAQGKKVYGLTLGDMTWDLYWYSNYFALPEYLIQMNKITCTIFNLMGNHDNDPYVYGDWGAEEAFKNIIGPTYYSFNLGNIHYIVLDNTKYLNNGASQGVIGDRSFDNYITADQLNWLQKDLAYVNHSTPLIIGLHEPLYKSPVVDVNGNYQVSYAMDNGGSFTSLLNNFTDVHILSGHTHRNNTVEASSSIMEHNTAAVCATWWWTGKNGYAGNHICKDGSPGGYGVWEMNDTDIEWYYKSINYDRNYQFRSYDLNTILITAENFAPNSTDLKLADYAGEYASPNNANEVLIDIWAYDKSWDIKVTENGNELAVTQVNAMDPLHIISYEALRLNVGATPTDAFVTDPTSHFFKVKASGPTSTLEIIVTDRFGNIYSESMERPKEFTYLMR